MTDHRYKLLANRILSGYIPAERQVSGGCNLNSGQSQPTAKLDVIFFARNIEGGGYETPRIRNLGNPWFIKNYHWPMPGRLIGLGKNRDLRFNA